MVIFARMMHAPALASLACLLLACASTPAQEEAPSPPQAPPPEAPSTTEPPGFEDPGPHPGTGLSRIRFPVAGETFTFEIADDAWERGRGMSGRARIPANEGMIFVYPKPEILGYWMKGCLTDIDIVYVRGDGRIMSMHRMKKEPPRGGEERLETYEDRLPRYSSRRLVQFALEFAPGTIDRLGLETGQLIKVPRAALLKNAR